MTMTDTRTRPGDAQMRADKIVYEQEAQWKGRWNSWGVNRLKLKMLIATEIEDAVNAERERVDALIRSMTGLDPEAPVREVGNMLKASRRHGTELPTKRYIDRYPPTPPYDPVHSHLLGDWAPAPHHPSHHDSSSGFCDGGSSGAGGSDAGGGDCGSSSGF